MEFTCNDLLDKVESEIPTVLSYIDGMRSHKYRKVVEGAKQLLQDP